MLNKKIDQTILEVYNKNYGILKLAPLNYKSKEDYKLFKEMVCDIDIMKQASLFNGNIGREEKEIRKYFFKMTESNSVYGIGLYKILDKKENFIGLTGLGVVETTKEKEIKTLELIYYLKRPYRGQKIGFNVSQRLLEYAFKNYLELKSILGISFYNNRPSHIIMLKLGFEYQTRKIKRGAVINYSILTRKMYNNHKSKSTEYYKKILEEIINKEYPVLQEVEDYLI